MSLLLLTLTSSPLVEGCLRRIQGWADDDGYQFEVGSGRQAQRNCTPLWSQTGPSPSRQVQLKKQDDLLHLIWKDRLTGGVEHDLIIFPGDATMKKVLSFPLVFPRQRLLIALISFR